MNEKITISLDKELIGFALGKFGNEGIKTDYSEFVENLLKFFLKPKYSVSENDIIEKKISNLLAEPEISIENLEKNYRFDLKQVEGKWPGEEPIELLCEKIK